MRWKERVRAWIPTRSQINENRWLRWLGPWLRQPRLWRWSRRGVAMGVALGIRVARKAAQLANDKA